MVHYLNEGYLENLSKQNDGMRYLIDLIQLRWMGDGLSKSTPHFGAVYLKLKPDGWEENLAIIEALKQNKYFWQYLQEYHEGEYTFLLPVKGML